METVKFTEEDYNLLKELINITSSILETYEDLYDLEMNGRKDTSEYDAIMEALKFYLNQEKDLYKMVKEDENRGLLFLDYLYPDGSPDFTSSVTLLMNIKNGDLIKIRMSERLNDIICHNEIEDYINSGSDDEDLNDFYISYVIDHGIEVDLVNTLLAILKEFINNSKYEIIKDKLLKLKYDLAFIYEFAEEELGCNLFNIRDVLYWSLKLSMEISQIDEIDVTEDVKDYTDSMIDYLFEELEMFTKEDISNVEKLTHMAFLQIYFRTCILFLSPTEVEKLKKTFDLELPLLGINDIEIKEMINEIFKTSEKDKELPRILDVSPNLI